jgi:hypothetical protein
MRKVTGTAKTSAVRLEAAGLVPRFEEDDRELLKKE